ncbi:MAG TPA: metalloregulator ArsR/SmtB family transcription factor [Metalysinibacillus sp.]
MIQQLKALADDNRLLIIACLKNGECCVCDLVTVLTISQPAVSQHLKKLKEAEIIEERTEGKWKYYKLVTPMTPIVASVVAQLDAPCFTKGACKN